MFASAIASDGDNTLPLNISSFTGNTPHPLTENAVAFVAGSVKIHKEDGKFMGTVDAISVNTILQMSGRSPI
jgi:hypothetical protein